VERGKGVVMGLRDVVDFLEFEMAAWLEMSVLSYYKLLFWKKRGRRHTQELAASASANP
jgi:hypothetical protein